MSHVFPLLLGAFLASCVPATHSDSADVACSEVSRVGYAEGSSLITGDLATFVADYTALEGAWTADVTCVGGSSGTMAVTLTTAAPEDLEVATYEGASCGSAQVSVLGETQAVFETGAVSLPDGPLATRILDGEAWWVIQMSSETSGTSIDIEVSETGEIRGSSVAVVTTGGEQTTTECELTGWVR